MRDIRGWLDKFILASLCTMIFTLPFSKSITEVCIIIAIVLWILKRSKPVRTEINFLIYLFILVGALSTVASVSIPLSLRGFFLKLLKGTFLFFVTVDSVNEKKKLGLVMLAILLSAIIVCIDGAWQLISGRDFIRHYVAEGGRIRASFGNANSLAGWLTVIFPLVLGIVVTGKRPWPKGMMECIAWILACPLVFCLMMTCSRSAWIGVILASIFIGVFSRRKLLTIVIPAMMGLPFIIPVSIKEHILKMLKFTVSYPIKGRLASIVSFTDPVRVNLWREAIAVIRAHPLFGCGLNTYSIVAPNYKVVTAGGIYPHNSYLQMAAEMGFVGLTVFAWLMLMLFIISLDNMMKIRDDFYKSILLGLSAGLLGFLVHSFFDVNFYVLQLANLMWFTIGLIIAVQKIALKEIHA